MPSFSAPTSPRPSHVVPVLVKENVKTESGEFASATVTMQGMVTDVNFSFNEEFITRTEQIISVDFKYVDHQNYEKVMGIHKDINAQVKQQCPNMKKVIGLYVETKYVERELLFKQRVFHITWKAEHLTGLHNVPEENEDIHLEYRHLNLLTQANETKAADLREKEKDFEAKDEYHYYGQLRGVGKLFDGTKYVDKKMNEMGLKKGDWIQITYAFAVIEEPGKIIVIRPRIQCIHLMYKASQIQNDLSQDVEMAEKMAKREMEVKKRKMEIYSPTKPVKEPKMV